MLRFLSLSIILLFGISNHYSQTWAQMGTDVNGHKAYALFGLDVAIDGSGNTAIVSGVDYEVLAVNTPLIKVLHWNGSTWVQKGNDFTTASAPNPEKSIDINANGNVIAIGTPNPGYGVVQVYKWDGLNWQTMGASISGIQGGEDFGQDIMLTESGNTILIGSPRTSVDGCGVLFGNLRVFDWTGTTWMQRGESIVGEWTQDKFGENVAISSNGLVVVGGSVYNQDAGYMAGHVRAFRWTGFDWVQMGADIDGVVEGGISGASISINDNGHTVAIGSRYSDLFCDYCGSVAVYEWNGTSWLLKGNHLGGLSIYDYFGSCVRISADGNTLVSGAWSADGSNVNTGVVSIFDWDGSTWLKDSSSIEGYANGDRYGQYLDLSSDGNTIISSSVQGNTPMGESSGYVQFYSRSSEPNDPPPTIIAANITPNPVIELSTISFDEEVGENASVQVVSITGRVVINRSLNGGKSIRINKSELKPGIYQVVLINSTGKNSAGSFVVQ
ncbi:MAG: T9SS type A sorting domain-containing protein [Flavobacteriales bacterium]|nr:T9SS type A sorting domain-containing protein [Flavobacteriales bacterium]